MKYIAFILVLVLIFWLGFKTGSGKVEVKNLTDSTYIIKSNALRQENEHLKDISKFQDKRITELQNRRLTINKIYKDTIISILDTIIYEYKSKDSVSELRLAKLDTLVKLKDDEIEHIVAVNTFVLDRKNSQIDSLKIANTRIEKRIKRNKTFNKIGTILKLGLGIFIGSKL